MRKRSGLRIETRLSYISVMGTMFPSEEMKNCLWNPTRPSTQKRNRLNTLSFRRGANRLADQLPKSGWGLFIPSLIPLPISFRVNYELFSFFFLHLSAFSDMVEWEILHLHDLDRPQLLRMPF